MLGIYEQRNESWNFIKDGKFLDQVSNYKFLKEIFFTMKLAVVMIMMIMSSENQYVHK
jgi:hypothetical protein